VYIPSSESNENTVARFALVIGNQQYAQSPLRNALNDAQAISTALSEMGFKVSLLKDANSETMTQSVNDFYHAVHNDRSEDKLAVVYYAGHAIQINHANYLIPLGIKFDSQDTFTSSLYHLSDLFIQMRKAPGLRNIVILDACRNNPFEDSMNASINANVSSGLAPVKAPPNTLIAFATEPGGIALDGKSRNGVYTRHLLKYLAENLSVEEVFKKVRTGVAKDTRHKQIPWEHSSLLEEIYFNPPKNQDLPNIVVF
jgi:uncharacterized caspase-like protein